MTFRLLNTRSSDQLCHDAALALGRFASALFLIVLIQVNAGPAMSQGHATLTTDEIRTFFNPTNSQIAQNFSKLIFPNGPTRNLLHRFERPIRIALGGNLTKLTDQTVVHQVAQLTFLTGMDVAIVTSGKANFVILALEDIPKDLLGPYKNLVLQLFSSEGVLVKIVEEAKEKKSNCLVNVAADKTGAISTSLVVVQQAAVAAVAEMAAVKECLIRNISRGFGPTAELRGVDNTSFNPDLIAAVNLTDQDQMFMRLIYDSRIKSSMSYPQIEITALKILNELRPGK